MDASCQATPSAIDERRRGRLAGTRRRNALDALTEAGAAALRRINRRSATATLRRVMATLQGAATDPAQRAAFRGGRLTHESKAPGFALFAATVARADRRDGGRETAARRAARRRSAGQRRRARKRLDRLEAAAQRAERKAAALRARAQRAADEARAHRRRAEAAARQLRAVA